jgi:hypothetical protein
MRINDSCNGVGRIVKAIHEFKTKRDEKCDAEQEVRVERRASFCLQIARETNDCVNKPDNESHPEDGHADHSWASR